MSAVNERNGSEEIERMIVVKKPYVRPEVEVERFDLGQNIAACATKVLFGPEGDSKTCGEFFNPEPFSREGLQLQSVPYTPFYEKGCACYYTAPRDSGYFSS